MVEGQGSAWVRVTQLSNICLYVRFPLVIYKEDASKLETFAWKSYLHTYIYYTCVCINT